MQNVARSTNATNASTKFVIDLGQARSIGALALVVHNISSLGKVRWTGNTSNSFASPAYDSGWVDVWPTNIIPFSLRQWEDANFWTGQMSEEQRAGYQAPFIHQPAAAQYLRYWQCEIDDTTNAAGAVYIGRLFMAATWTATVNYNYGATLGYDDPTPVIESLSGAEYFDVRQKPRGFAFQLEWLTSTEAYSNVMDLQRLSGISGEVLVVPDSDDTANMPIRAMVGRLRSLGKIAQPHLNSYSASFEIKELL